MRGARLRDRLLVRATFRLTQGDLVALLKVINRRLTELSHAQSKLFFSNLLIWIPLGIAFAAYAALFRNYPSMTRDLAIVAVFFCIGIGLMVGGILFKQRVVYRRAMLAPDGWFLSEQTVDLSPDGVSVRSACGEAHYTWPSFRDIVEDEANLYLFIDNAQALVLPKHALGSPEQIAQLKTWAKP